MNSQPDLDAPTVSMSDEEQAGLRELIGRVSFYYMLLKGEEHLPDALVHDLVVAFHEALISRYAE